jgi:hypothetical protein
MRLSASTPIARETDALARVREGLYSPQTRKYSGVNREALCHV